MKYTNKFNLPSGVVSALTADNYSRGASNRSVTQLIDSPRVRILRAENEEHLVEDCSDRVWSVLGTAVHNIFEGHSENHDEELSEERLFLDVNGWSISGAIDLQRGDDEGKVAICDYKCTSVWSVVFGKEEWVNQLNAYAWLVRMSKGLEVSSLSILAVLRDFNKREAEKASNKDYPASPIVVVPIPMWSKPKQDAYMAKRIHAHQDAEFERLTGGTLPLCSDHERWTSPTKYAVRKKANKRALRVFDSQEEANTFFEAQEFDKMNTHIIDVRKGESRRCSGNYCNVAEYCDQYAAELEGEENAE